MKMLRAWPLAFFLALSACGDSAANYDPEKLATLHAKSLDLLSQMAQAGAAQKGNCDGVAAAWQEIYDANKATFDELSKATVAINTEQSKLTGDKKEAYTKEFAEPIEKAVETLTPIVSECSENEQIMALLEKVGAGGGGGGGGMSGH